MVTITRSPERRSRFRTCSRERAWSVIAFRVWGMAVKFSVSEMDVGLLRMTSQRVALTLSQERPFLGNMPRRNRIRRFSRVSLYSYKSQNRSDKSHPWSRRCSPERKYDKAGSCYPEVIVFSLVKSLRDWRCAEHETPQPVSPVL